MVGGNNPGDRIIRPGPGMFSRIFTIDGALVRLSGVTLAQGRLGGVDGLGGAISMRGGNPRMEITNCPYGHGKEPVSGLKGGAGKKVHG